MSVRGIQNQPPPAPIENREPSPEATGQNQNLETPLVSTQAGTVRLADNADIPSPDSIPGSIVQNKQRQLQKLTQLNEKIYFLVSRGDRTASPFLPKIEAAIASLTRDINELSVDNDGDGTFDIDDPDDDNDRLTDELERSLGTNPFDADTDKDGLRDDVEARIFPNAAERLGAPQLNRWANPLNPDNDGDGVVDGNQIPSQVGSELGIGVQSQSMVQTASPAPGYSSSVSRVEAIPNGNRIELSGGAGNYMITLPEGSNGHFEGSRRGTTLIVKFISDEGTQTILIPDADKKSIQFDGDVQFDFDLSELRGSDPLGLSGEPIRATDGHEVDTTLSPIHGARPEDDETWEGLRTITYREEELGSGDINLQLLGQNEGEELTRGRLYQDGNILYLDAMNRNGEVRVRTKIIADGNSSDIQAFLDRVNIRLDDRGQELEAEVNVKEIRGGRGNDNIYGQQGATVDAGAGDDRVHIREEGNGGKTTVHLGGGHDTYQGTSGDDEVYGEGGRDFIFMGDGGADRIDAGRDNDVVVTGDKNNPNATDDTIRGSDGIDIYNGFTGTGFETSARDMSGFLSHMRDFGSETDPLQLSQILEFEEDQVPYMQELILSESLDAALNYLDLKEQEFQARYRPQESAQTSAPSEAGTPFATEEPPYAPTEGNPGYDDFYNTEE